MIKDSKVIRTLLKVSDYFYTTKRFSILIKEGDLLAFAVLVKSKLGMAFERNRQKRLVREFYRLNILPIARINQMRQTNIFLIKEPLLQSDFIIIKNFYIQKFPNLAW